MAQLIKDLSLVSNTQTRKSRVGQHAFVIAALGRQRPAGLLGSLSDWHGLVGKFQASEGPCPGQKWTLLKAWHLTLFSVLHTYTWIWVHLPLCILMPVHVWGFTCACIHTYAYTRTHAQHTHAYIYTHRHMHAHHTHTCTHKYASVYSHTHVSLFLYFFLLCS